MGLLDVFREFAGGTSIHGFTFLVQPKLSKFTKILWALAIIGALVYASYQLNLSRICKLIECHLNLMYVYVLTYIHISHCYSIKSNLKKMGPLKFCLPVFLEIYRNPKKNLIRVRDF